MSYDIPSLEKQPVESRVYTFDFTANMAEDETISGITSIVSTPSGLTITGQTFSGKKVMARIADGATDTQYKITVLVTTSAGNTLSGEGNLFVRDV